MPRIVIASRNRGKIAEFQELLRGLEVDVLSLTDFPGLPEVAETGATFQENALLKARACRRGHRAGGGGRRFRAGGGLPQGCPGDLFVPLRRPCAGRCRQHQETADGPGGGSTEPAHRPVPVCDRHRHPGWRRVPERGRVRGPHYHSAPGGDGFGYDPVFLVPSLDQTFAELGAQVKNQISHRAQAMKNAGEILVSLFKSELEGYEYVGRSPERLPRGYRPGGTGG